MSNSGIVEEKEIRNAGGAQIVEIHNANFLCVELVANGIAERC